MNREAGGAITFVPVGAPLAPAEAAYLGHELGRRGIETRLRDADGTGPEMVVEVRATDLDAGAAVRRELLETPAEPVGGEGSTADAGGRHKALLAASTGAVFILYVGRALPAALRGVLAAAAGAVVYLAVRRAGRDRA